MFPLPANIYAEIAAFLTSVIFWPQLRLTKLRWLPLFLFFIVGVELTGRHIYKSMHQPNAWIYNISVPVEYLYYSYLFYTFYSRKIYRYAACLFIAGFTVWVIISIFFISGIYTFNDNFLKAGSISMVLFCLLYFIELLMADEMINPFTQPMFWIACGLFLFNAGEFAYDTFSHILMKKWMYGKKLFAQINNNLIFVLYSSIIIAIISAAWIPKEKT